MAVSYTSRSRRSGSSRGGSSEKTLTFTGTGGRKRTWATHGWFDTTSGFNQLQATVGPYALTFWRHTSREPHLTSGQEVFSAQLFKDRKLLVSTNVARDGRWAPMG